MTMSPRRRTEVLVVAVAVAVVSTIVAVGLVVASSTGPTGTFSDEGETITARIESYRVSMDGDATLCMDLGGDEDVANCTSPLVLSGSTGRLANGETITVTPLWLGPVGDNSSTFMWLVH